MELFPQVIKLIPYLLIWRLWGPPVIHKHLREVLLRDEVRGWWSERESLVVIIIYVVFFLLDPPWPTGLIVKLGRLSGCRCLLLMRYAIQRGMRSATIEAVDSFRQVKLSDGARRGPVLLVKDRRRVLVGRANRFISHPLLLHQFPLPFEIIYHWFPHFHHLLSQHFKHLLLLTLSLFELLQFSVLWHQILNEDGLWIKVSSL